MGKRPDLTKYQRGIVDRYYEHQGTIYAQKLSELVSEIALVPAGEEHAKQRDKLWKRAEEYLVKVKAPATTVQTIVGGRDVKALAQAAGAVMAGKPVPKVM